MTTKHVVYVQCDRCHRKLAPSERHNITLSGVVTNEHGRPEGYRVDWHLCPECAERVHVALEIQ